MPVTRSMRSKHRASWRMNPYRMTKRQRTARSAALPSASRGYSRISGYYGRYAPLGTELKFLDTTASTTASASGTIANSTLNNVAAGTGESQRVGRKVTIRSVHIRYTGTINNTSNPIQTDDGLRVMLYWDRQCNGSAATVTDILETASFRSFNNLSNKNRFAILYDAVMDVSATAGAYDGTNDQFGTTAKTKSAHMRGLNIPVEFSSTTGAIAEVRSNNLGLLVISDNGLMNFNSNVRIRFSDN